MQNHENLVTMSELALILRVHVSTVRSWNKKGKITGYGIGKIVRFDRNQVLQALTQHGTSETVRYGSLKNRLGIKHSNKMR
jgi:excisionase family DNA binding protein